LNHNLRLFTLIGLAGLMLAMVFIFQRFNYFGLITNVFGASVPIWPYTAFVVNKVIRFLVNDAICILFIFILFKETKYLRVAFLVFWVELLFILPLYFWIKLSTEGDTELSSPLLSQIHRLIINPTLMILLIVSFLYQKRRAKSE